MRVGVHAPRRLGDADQLQQRDGLLARGAPRDLTVGADRLDHLCPHAVQRVQRGERVLEDDRQLRAAQRAQAGLRKRHEVHAIEQDAPRDARSLRAGEPHQGQRSDGLARPRLPHDPERAPGVNLEGDAVHGVHHPVFGGQFYAQVFHT